MWSYLALFSPFFPLKFIRSNSVNSFLFSPLRYNSVYSVHTCPILSTLILFGPFCWLWFYLVPFCPHRSHSVHFDQLQSYSVYFVHFCSIWFILSTLVLFSPHSTFVQLGPVRSILSTSVPPVLFGPPCFYSILFCSFGPLCSIWSIWITSVHFGPLQSIFVRLHNGKRHV